MHLQVTYTSRKRIAKKMDISSDLLKTKWKVEGHCCPIYLDTCFVTIEFVQRMTPIKIQLVLKSDEGHTSDIIDS